MQIRILMWRIEVKLGRTTQMSVESQRNKNQRFVCFSDQLTLNMMVKLMVLE